MIFYLLNEIKNHYEKTINYFTTLIFVFIIVGGCKKNQSVTNDNNTTLKGQQLIKEAMDYFKNNIQNLANKGRPLDELDLRADGSFNPVKSMIKCVDWENAKIVSVSVGDIVVVPILFNDSLYSRPVGTSGSSLKTAINKISKLVVYGGVDKKKHVEVVSSFPDLNYISNTKNSFTGVVYVQDWQGVYLRGYLYQKDGQISQLSISDTILNNKPSTNSIAPSVVVTPSSVCEYVDVYTCVGSSCTFAYTEDLGCSPTSVVVVSLGSQGLSSITATDYNVVSGGGTSVSNSGSGANVVYAAPQNPIDIVQAMKCFSSINTSTYSITLNVEEPLPGTGQSASLGPVQAGHTYLTFEQDNADGTKIIRNNGFYPATSANPISPQSSSVFGENSNTAVSAQLKIYLSPTNFMNAVSSEVNQISYNYNLYTNNCTTAALTVLQNAGVNYLYSYTPPSPFIGDYPGLLGGTIRNLDLNTFSQENGGDKVVRSVIDKNSLLPPPAQGGCSTIIPQ